MKKVLLLLLFSISVNVFAQISYYRTSGSGNFSDPGIWEELVSGTYVAASSAPIDGTHNIQISVGHVVNLDVDLIMDDNITSTSPDVVVYGTLIFDNSHDITLQDGYQHSTYSKSVFATSSSSVLQVNDNKSLFGLTGHVKQDNGILDIDTLTNYHFYGNGTQNFPSDISIAQNIIVHNGTLNINNPLTVYGLLETWVYPSQSGSFYLNAKLIQRGTFDPIYSINMSSGPNASLYIENNSGGVEIPSLISVLKELKIAIPAGQFVSIDNNLTISDSQGLQLVSGKLISVSDDDTLFLLHDEPVYANANSHVSCSMGIYVETFPPGQTSQFINFPIGRAHTLLNMRVNLATNGVAGCFLVATAYNTAPSGSTNNLTATGSMANQYWRLKVKQTSSFFSTNTIASIFNIELQTNNVSPALTSSSVLAFSADNANNSYEGINSSVSAPYLTSLQLSATQIQDLGSVNGSFIGIAKKTLAPGVYCIGPSNSYSPPAGSSYSYENANNPFGNLSEALYYLDEYGTNGHITFELQNNYTGNSFPPFASEFNPIAITYQGSVNRTLLIKVRNDLSTPLNISVQRPHASATGVISFDGAKYVTLDGSINGVCNATKGIIIQNNGASTWNTNCISFNNAASFCTVKGLQVERDFGNGIYINCSSGSTGCSDLTIDCNRIIPRANVFAGMSIRNSFSGGTNKNERIFIKNNSFEGAQYNIYVSPSNARGVWEITDNHFYEPSGQNIGTFYLLDLSDTGTVKINNNYFGGSAPYCGGNSMQYAQLGTSQLSVSANSIHSSEFIGNHIENLENQTLDPTTNSQFFSFYNSGFSINNNVFGNPSMAQSIRSTNLYHFIGFYIAQSSNTSHTTLVNGNSFNNLYFPNGANSTGSSQGGFYPIYIYRNINGAGSMNTTINNNTFQHITTGAGYGVSFINATGSGGTAEVKNNIIEDVNLVSNTTPSVDIIRLYNDNSVVVNNRIGNLSVLNDIKLKGGYVHPFNVSSPGGSLQFDSNTVANTLITSPYTYSRCMYANSSSTNTATYNYNTVENVTYDVNVIGSANITAMYFLSAGSSLKEIRHNIVNHVEQINPTTAGAIHLTGMYIGGSSNNNTVENNSVHGLQNICFSTATLPSITGMEILNFGRLTNNIISLNNSYLNDIEIFGIKNNSYQQLKVKHNTVLVDGTSGGNSYAYYKSYVPEFVSGDTVKNNIFYNKRTGTGKNYAIYRNYLYTSYDIGVCNYNNLYSADPTTLGRWNYYGSDLTFAQWKAASGQDANSKNAMVKFLSPATNLLIDASTNCALDGAAQPNIGVIYDINGIVRNITTPDMGAHEFTALPYAFALATSNSPICETGGSLNLEATTTTNAYNPYSYVWSGPNAYTSSLSNPIINTPTQAQHQGTYTVTISDAFGCTATSTTQVVITNPLIWYLDMDGDAYSTGAAITACTSPGIGYTTSVAGTNDCDDNNPNRHPNATEICGNNIDDNCDGNVDEGCTTVNILAGKVFMQGYYIGSGFMNSVLLNQNESINPLVCDSIQVELHDPSNNMNIIYSTNSVVETNGEFTIIGIPNSLLNNSYYLAIRHRNCVETWSYMPILITSYTYYNFTTNASNAYGDNQLEIEPGVFALFTGDINQDGFIDSFDFPSLDTDIFNGVSGVYANTDLNGDGFVDSFDFPLFDANSYFGVSVITP